MADVVVQPNASDLYEPLEVAGSGFINFRIRVGVLIQAATAVLEGLHYGLSRTLHSWRIVVDYPTPNIVKQMHVGHLHITIVGDCSNRVLTALGYEVIPQNHVGDQDT